VHHSQFDGGCGALSPATKSENMMTRFLGDLFAAQISRAGSEIMFVFLPPLGYQFDG
jgi:hypothetical protein